MTSLFIDSSTRVDGNNYRIPTKIDFTGVKLRSAIILNNQYNVKDFSVNLTIPSTSFAMDFAIADGYYNGQELASELQNLLNSEFIDDNWKISFSTASKKFTFLYKDTATTTAFLTFNTASQPFFGATALTFVTDSIHKEDSNVGSQSINVQSFYRIESPSLSSLGYVEHDSPHSGLLAVVPVTGSFGNYSIYENPDNYFMRSTNTNDIYNFLQVNIFLGDSPVPLENPVFGLTFQFV